MKKKKVMVKKTKKSGEHMMDNGSMMKDSEMKGMMKKSGMKKPSKKAMAYMKKVGVSKK